MIIREAIEQYIIHLSVHRRYSVHTTISYKNDLSQMADFLEQSYGVVLVKDCEPGMLRSHVVQLAVKGLTAKTINRKISSLRSFYGYLLKNEFITKDLTEKIVAPRIPKRLPEFIKESEAMEMEEWVVEESFTAYRDYTVVELLYHTGMRRSELINLDLDDLDLNRMRLKVLGKGNKERIIPLAGNIFHILKKYITLRNDSFPGIKHEALILTDKGKRSYPRMIYNIVNRLLATATTSSKRSPHILRHSFASHLLNNGADLNAIKEMLGHANLSATQVYTHNSISKLKEAYRKAHPKGS